MWSGDDVRDLFAEVSNWGRWGVDDELGTLNLLGPGKVLQGCRLVEHGRVVSLAHDLDPTRTEKNRFPISQMMLYMGEDPVTVADSIASVAPRTASARVGASRSKSTY